MHYTVTTRLKKADTDGRIPAFTLDQYVRAELAKQLINCVQNQLRINRLEPNNSSEMVDFSSEIVVFEPLQWQRLKESLLRIVPSLPLEQQVGIRQQIDAIEQA